MSIAGLGNQVTIGNAPLGKLLRQEIGAYLAECPALPGFPARVPVPITQDAAFLTAITYGDAPPWLRLTLGCTCPPEPRDTSALRYTALLQLCPAASAPHGRWLARGLAAGEVVAGGSAGGFAGRQRAGGAVGGNYGGSRTGCLLSPGWTTVAFGVGFGHRQGCLCPGSAPFCRRVPLPAGWGAHRQERVCHGSAR